MANKKTTNEVIAYLMTEIEAISLGKYTASHLSPSQRIIEDLGFDSLDYATLMLSCEAWFGVKVSERQIDWSTVETIGGLAELYV
jgi:acyl carrier protein